jgi:predicted HD superfamily hydrolase involved in NAD metabolism
MPTRLAHLVNGFPLTGELSQDAPALLRHHGRPEVARHVEEVAARAAAIARKVGADPKAAQCAAWLHDISLVLPYAAMAGLAAECGLELLPEDRQAPALIHGRLSAVLAEQLFGVTDQAVLDAMRYHTTLRAKPTLLDCVLFIADKLTWDPAQAPWRAELEAALERSLDDAVWFFLQNAWQEREKMAVIHPWFRQAYEWAEACQKKGHRIYALT